MFLLWLLMMVITVVLWNDQMRLNNTLQKRCELFWFVIVDSLEVVFQILFVKQVNSVKKMLVVKQIKL